MRLRHFQPDGTTTDNDQMLRLLTQIKQGFVRLIGDGIKARDRRHKGARSGRDYNTARRDLIRAGLHSFGVNKFAKLPDHPNAHPLKPLLAINGCDRVDHLVHMILGRGIADLGHYRGHAKFGAMGHRMGLLARRDQSLGRNAAKVEAIAAHLVTFQQHHIGAHLAGTCGHGQPA